MAVHCFVTASSMVHSPIFAENLTGIASSEAPRKREPRDFRRRGASASLVVFLFLCVAATASHAQSFEVVCRDGAGDFDSLFHTGVELRVGAARNGELATRTCEGALEWDRQRLVVASGVAQVDVDVFGVDLGLRVPVTALQVKKVNDECCREYPGLFAHEALTIAPQDRRRKLFQRGGHRPRRPH